MFPFPSSWRYPDSWKRSLRPTRAGAVFTAGTLAVGLAAVNTGNNLLFLLLGSMLGVMVAGGWLSEQLLMRLHVRRIPPRGCHAGEEGELRYVVENRSRWIPALGIALSEDGIPARTGWSQLPPGSRRQLTARSEPLPRGVRKLKGVELSTAFPFGLFRKARPFLLPGEWRIWPALAQDGESTAPTGDGMEMASTPHDSPWGSAARGEFRSLREYRWGDAPTDVHWPASARRGELVVRDFERPQERGGWLRLDLARAPGPEAEDELRRLASLLRDGATRALPLGVWCQEGAVPPWAPGSGPEGALDLLAQVRFDPAHPPLLPEPPQ